MRSIHLINSAFLSLKIIVDTLTDVGNAKHQNITSKISKLRWLEIVSSTYTLIGRYNHSLSLDATIMVSKNCPTIGEHVVTIFVTQ